jgi:hypothetical protein
VQGALELRRDHELDAVDGSLLWPQRHRNFVQSRFVPLDCLPYGVADLLLVGVAGHTHAGKVDQAVIHDRVGHGGVRRQI